MPSVWPFRICRIEAAHRHLAVAGGAGGVYSAQSSERSFSTAVVKKEEKGKMKQQLIVLSARTGRRCACIK